jgi:hypothetical protein
MHRCNHNPARSYGHGPLSVRCRSPVIDRAGGDFPLHCDRHVASYTRPRDAPAATTAGPTGPKIHADDAARRLDETHNGPRDTRGRPLSEPNRSVSTTHFFGMTFTMARSTQLGRPVSPIGARGLSDSPRRRSLVGGGSPRLKAN